MNIPFAKENHLCEVDESFDKLQLYQSDAEINRWLEKYN